MQYNIYVGQLMCQCVNVCAHLPLQDKAALGAAGFSGRAGNVWLTAQSGEAHRL